MPKCALPNKYIQDPKGRLVNLRNALHWDWPWPLSYIPRHINAFGPNCPVKSFGYKKWPPILIEGFGVARWEAENGNSWIEIPEFKHAKITYRIYNNYFEAIERNPGHVNFNQKLNVKLTRTGIYSPSALQRFSHHGYMKLSPWYVAQWLRIKKRDNKEDLYLFHREGFRPDHVDQYYNWGPMLGLKMD